MIPILRPRYLLDYSRNSIGNNKNTSRKYRPMEFNFRTLIYFVIFLTSLQILAEVGQIKIGNYWKIEMNNIFNLTHRNIIYASRICRLEDLISNRGLNMCFFLIIIIILELYEGVSHFNSSHIVRKQNREGRLETRKLVVPEPHLQSDETNPAEIEPAVQRLEDRSWAGSTVSN